MAQIEQGMNYALQTACFERETVFFSAERWRVFALSAGAVRAINGRGAERGAAARGAPCEDDVLRERGAVHRDERQPVHSNHQVQTPGKLSVIQILQLTDPCFVLY